MISLWKKRAEEPHRWGTSEAVTASSWQVSQERLQIMYGSGVYTSHT